MRADLHSDIELKRLISPTRQTNSDTAIVSQIIDCAGASLVELLIAYGSLTDANATVTALLEDGEEANLSDAAAVADEFLLGTEAAAGAAAASDDNKVAKLGYIGRKRYIRLTLTPSGNDSGNVDVSAVAILGRGRTLPEA